MAFHVEFCLVPCSTVFSLCSINPWWFPLPIVLRRWAFCHESAWLKLCLYNETFHDESCLLRCSRILVLF